VYRESRSASINVQIEVECDAQVAPVDWIGGDMGRTDILHTSNGRSWSGNLRKSIRDRARILVTLSEASDRRGHDLERSAGGPVTTPLSSYQACHGVCVAGVPHKDTR
jgi:hypothetical protein